MSSDSSAVFYLQQIGFCQVASAAALLYDYLLTFGSEVDLIWAREWNFVTILYAIVRYLSFFLILINNLYMGDVNWSSNVSLAWYEIRMWGPYIFRVAMDIIMMKRIYALSHRPSRFLNSPKSVLSTMIVAFIAKYAMSITFLFLSVGPGSHLTSLEANFSGTHVCGTMIPRSAFVIYSQFPTLGFEILLFVLAFGYFAADVWEFWRSKETNAWQVSDLVQILVRDSTIYFAINLAATTLNVGNYKTPAPDIYIAISSSLQAFLPYCFAPRLVINVKQHENRTHMSGFGGELSDIRFDEGPGLSQDMRPADDFA